MAQMIEKISSSAEHKMATTSYKRYGTDTEMHLNMIDLGINSVYGAIFLNRFLDYKKSGWGRGNVGIFRKISFHIGITETNEVKFITNNVGDLILNIRSAKSEADYKKALKDKLANELKKWCEYLKPTPGDGPEKTINAGGKITLAQGSDHWNGYDIIGIFNLVTGEKIEKYDWRVHEKETFNQVKFSYKDYRCVYEILKGRDPEKIKKKYGKECFDRMIGSKIEDQFVIAAIDVIKNKIAEIEDMRTSQFELEKQRFDEELSKLKFSHEKRNGEIMAMNDAKIAELSEQIKLLITSSKQTSNETAAD